MTTARLRVTAAGPLVTYQDAGRSGHMRFGVARSGPMDRLAHAAANVALGTPVEATTIEVSRAGLALEVVSGSVTVATTGGDVAVRLGGRAVPHWNAVTLRTGDRLSIRQGDWGSWSYLAFAGRIAVSTWLGHTATHSTSGLGGGALTAGTEFDVINASVVPEREGGIPVPAGSAPTRVDGEPIRVVIGPQHRHFPKDTTATLTSSTFRLTGAYDRMGVRLEGPALAPEHALSIPSEPIVRGSIQVSGDGVPTVLLADHQTTGGYPKIATVISTDLDRFAQLRSGDDVVFVAVEPDEAVEIARQASVSTSEYLGAVGGSGRTLTHRLRSINLVGGVVAAEMAKQLDD